MGLSLLSSSAQAAVTKYHRLGGFNNRHLFLTVLEAEKSEIKVPADSVPGLQTITFSLCTHMAFPGYEGVERELSCFFLFS